MRSSAAIKNTLAPLTLLLALISLQLAFSPSWMYTPNGIDDWVYHGYFVHLRNHIVEFAGTYYGTRLAWILPGALVYHLFQPEGANLALRMLLYVVTLFSGFFLLRRSYGVRCATLCCLLLAGDSDFLSAIGWDYVDGVGIAYLTLVLEELSAASQALARGRILASWVRGCLAGLFYAGAVHCNTLLLIFIPILALGFFARSGINRRSLAFAPSTIAGAALSTIGLGWIDRSLGGPFLFFLPSIKFMLSMGAKPNPWREPVRQWLSGGASWLVLPSAVTVLSLFCMLYWWRSRSGDAEPGYLRNRFADTSMIVAAWIVFTILQLGNSPMFQFHYVTSYLIPFMFVAVGAMIGRTLDEFPAWAVASFVVVSALMSWAIGAQFLRTLPSFAVRFIDRPLAFQYSVVTLVLTGGAAVILKYRWMSVVLAGMGAFWWFGRLGAETGSIDKKLAREEFLAVSRATSDLTKYMGPRRLYFWYGDHQADFSMQLSSTFLWGYRVIGFKMPDTSNLALPPGVRLVMLASGETEISDAREALVRTGYRVSPVAEWREPAPGSEVGIVDVVKTRLPERTLVGQPVHAEPGETVRLAQWLGGKLMNDGEIHFYGPTGASAVRPLLFRSENPADHVASRSILLPKSLSLRGIRIEADLPDFSKAYGGGRLLLQDQGFRTLYDSGTAFEETLRVTVPIPQDVTSVRTVFVPNEDNYLIVSTNLSVGAVVKR